MTFLPTQRGCRGLLMHLITLKHTHAHTLSAELLWTSDRPDAATSTWQHPTDGNPSKRATADRRLHTQWHTLGRTPLDEWSARRSDLYLTTHNRRQSQQATDAFTHNDTHSGQNSSGRAISPTQRPLPDNTQQTAIPASEQPQTDAFDRAATGIGPFLPLWSEVNRNCTKTHNLPPTSRYVSYSWVWISSR